MAQARSEFRLWLVVKIAAAHVEQLAGLPLPASVLERDILPARIPGYQPRLLDELGALGEVAWVGCGPLGRDDGRIALVRPGREAIRPVGPPDGVERPADPRHEAIRDHLTRRGASFYRELFAAAGGGSERDVLDALWDLVWAGEVTNDAWTPLRAARRYGTPVADRRPRRFARTRAAGTTSTQGRWSLTSRLFPAAVDRRALAELLLERQGIVVRDGVQIGGRDRRASRRRTRVSGGCALRLPS